MSKIIPDLAGIGKIAWTGGVQMFCADHRWANKEIKGMYRLFTDGCYGDISDDDFKSNLKTIASLEGGGRLLGIYTLSDKTIIWILTTGYKLHQVGDDYCNTVIMFPHEY